jgi:hypothetical protein
MKILPALLVLISLPLFLYEKPIVSPLSNTQRIVWAKTEPMEESRPTSSPQAKEPQPDRMEAPIQPSIRTNGESESGTDKIIEEIQKVWGPEGHKEIARAIAIAYCESKFNERAYNWNTNGSEDFGVFQVNSVHKPTKDEMGNYQANIRKAKEIYDRAGKSWRPWACKKVLGF